MSATVPSAEILARLRDAIGDVPVGQTDVLPFDIEPLDTRLTDGGLALNGLHEVTSTTPTLTDDAAATLFAVGSPHAQPHVAGGACCGR